MSRRNTSDPLLKRFLQDYKLNLLRIPRQDASVGDVYVDLNGTISPPGRLESLLVPRLAMPKVKSGEKLTDLATTKTRAIELKAGIGLLEGFFSALGAAGVAAKIKGAYERKDAGYLRFRLKNATRDSVDPIALGTAISKCRLDAKNPFVQDAARYYVTVGVIRSPSITVTGQDKNDQNVSMQASALKQALTADGKVSVKNENDEELTYQGREALAFGVELVELKYDKTARRFQMAGLDQAVKIRDPAKVAKAFVGDGKSGDVFLNMREEYVVLASDWDGGRDPVPYFSTDPAGCLDFNSALAKPRSVLVEVGRKTMDDCQHSVTYDVVICQFKGQ